MPSAARVTFLIPSLSGGGAERVVLSVIAGLDRSRIEPTLVVISNRDSKLRNEIPHDIEVVNLNAARLLTGIPRLMFHIWRSQPDVIFTTLDHLNTAIGFLRPLLPHRTRWVARITDFRFQEDPPLAYRMGSALRKADAVIVQSAEMGTVATERLALTSTGVHHIANPLRLERIRLAAEQVVQEPWPDAHFRLLAAGRLVREKGFEPLIEAISRMDRKDAALVILGDGPDKFALIELTQKLGVEHRVRFLGFQNNPYAYMRRADLFVLPSALEGFPNVVLEALACGLPVITTPLPGLREIVEETPGCTLAEGFGYTPLLDALNRHLRRPSAKVSPRWIDHHDARTVANAYACLFENLINDQR